MSTNAKLEPGRYDGIAKAIVSAVTGGILLICVPVVVFVFFIADSSGPHTVKSMQWGDGEVALVIRHPNSGVFGGDYTIEWTDGWDRTSDLARIDHRNTPEVYVDTQNRLVVKHQLNDNAEATATYSLDD